MGWTIPRTWSYDEVPSENVFNTHVRDNLLALREIAYTTMPSNVTVTGTAEGSATTIVTASAVTCDGTSSIIVEFFSPIISAGALVMECYVYLFQDGTSLGAMGLVGVPANVTGTTCFLQRKVTPASGSRTFSIRAWKQGTGNPVVNTGAGTIGTYAPAFIRIRA